MHQSNSYFLVPDTMLLIQQEDGWIERKTEKENKKKGEVQALDDMLDWANS